MIALAPLYFYLEWRFPFAKVKTLLVKREVLQDLFWQFVEQYLTQYLVVLLKMGLFISLVFLWQRFLGRDISNTTSAQSWVRDATFGSRFSPSDFGGVVPQFIFVFCLRDLYKFFIHWAMHRVPFLWRLHILHHSSIQLNWISMCRVHAFESALSTILVDWVLILFGLPVSALTLVAILETHNAFILHTNTRISYGPLTKWVNNTLAHHWHHAEVCHFKGGQNFGSFFLIWDRIFKTLYIDSGKKPPEKYGVASANHYPSSPFARIFFPIARPGKLNE